MKRKGIVVLFTVLSVGLGSVQTALADAAPPDPPPGSSVGAGDPSTYVQMVSESVLMEITDYDGPPLWDRAEIASDLLVGHVQATFDMVNQGTETETMAVRFPLGLPYGFPGLETVKNFTATVNGESAETKTIEQKGERDTVVPWATWEATFTPGQTVVLGVEYDVQPEGYAPWGAFTYILETGAGWYGPIGEGTIVYRLPYQVNDLNTVPGNDWWRAELSNTQKSYTVSGTDVAWHFTNLEPTSSDNIHFTVLPPAVWARIEQAQAAAQANPDSAETQLELGDALSAALWSKGGLSVGSSATLAQQAEAAYKRAWELGPDNVEVCIGYLDWMFEQWWIGDPATKPEDLVTVLEHVKGLSPNDPRVVEVLQRYEQYQQSETSFLYAPETMTAEAGSIPTPASTLTAIPLAIVTPSPVPIAVPASSSGAATRPSVWILAVPLTVLGFVAASGTVLLGVWVSRGKRPVRK